MKLWSKEALVLGGIYWVLDIVFSFSGFEMISHALFWLFTGSALMLCFNKTPKYLALFITQHPKTSYYLASFGWIPYVILIVTIAILGSTFVTAYPENFVAVFLYGTFYVGLILVLFSLMAAFIKSRKNSSDN